MLHTGVRVDTMGLSGVSRQVVVDELDDVVSDGSREDSWGSHFFEHC